MAKFGIIAACVLLFACSTYQAATSTSVVMQAIITTMSEIKEQVESSMTSLSSNMAEAIAQAQTMASESIAAVDEVLATVSNQNQTTSTEELKELIRAKVTDNYNADVASAIGTDEADLDACLALSDTVTTAAADASLEVTSCIDSKVSELQEEYNALYAAYEEAFTILSELISEAESCDASTWFSGISCYVQVMASGMTDGIESMETISGNITALQLSISELSAEMIACGTTTVAATVAEQAVSSLEEIIACTLEVN